MKTCGRFDPQQLLRRSWNKSTPSKSDPHLCLRRDLAGPPQAAHQSGRLYLRRPLPAQSGSSAPTYARDHLIETALASNACEDVGAPGRRRQPFRSTAVLEPIGRQRSRSRRRNDTVRTTTPITAAQMQTPTDRAKGTGDHRLLPQDVNRDKGGLRFEALHRTADPFRTAGGCND